MKILKAIKEMWYKLNGLAKISAMTKFNKRILEGYHTSDITVYGATDVNVRPLHTGLTLTVDDAQPGILGLDIVKYPHQHVVVNTHIPEQYTVIRVYTEDEYVPVIDEVYYEGEGDATVELMVHAKMDYTKVLTRNYRITNRALAALRNCDGDVIAITVPEVVALVNALGKDHFLAFGANLKAKHYMAYLYTWL